MQMNMPRFQLAHRGSATNARVSESPVLGTGVDGRQSGGLLTLVALAVGAYFVRL